MKKNIGTIGRCGRAALGIALIVYAYVYRSPIALLAGLFALFEAYKSFCVVYHLLGIKACRMKCKKK